MSEFAYCALAAAILAFAIWAVASSLHDPRRAECEARGGVLVRSTWSYVCAARVP